MDNRGEGSIKIFRRNFFVSQSQSFRRGILYCCSNVGYRKSLDKKGEYQGFPSGYFCPTVPKIFVGESFAVASISGIAKVWIRGVGVSRFSVENFSSHSAEIFRAGIHYCCINFGN